MKEKMKILLIAPNLNTPYVAPPLGLGYLAKALVEKGFEVEIINGAKYKLNLNSLREILKQKKPDVIGIQIFSYGLNIVKSYLDLIEKEFPNICKIVGGAHVSGVGKKIFSELNNINFAFHGEAEIGFPLLLKEIESNKDFGKVPGLIWKKGKEIVMNLPEFIQDLDKIGMPSWELMDDLRDLNPVPQGAIYKRYPIGVIITSRGCPHQCTFCVNHKISGRKIRIRSVKNIIEEIEFLIERYGMNELLITDDNFTYDKERVKEFCNEIIRRKIDISIAFPNGVRLDTLDDEVLDLLKKSGCYSITLGIESGSQKILNDMKKALTIKVIKEKVKLIDKKGIDVSAFFIIGYPTETKETIGQTIEFARNLEIKKAHFSIFLPLPGAEATELFEKSEIEKIDYSDMFYTKAPVSPRGMTTNQLKWLQRKAFFKFYFRPKIIFYMVKEIHSFNHLKSLGRRAFDCLKFRPKGEINIKI